MFALTSKPSSHSFKNLDTPTRVLIFNQTKAKCKVVKGPQNTPAAVLSKRTGNEGTYEGFEKSERG